MIPRALVLPDGSERPVSDLYGRNVLAHAGVGNPEAFAAALEALGARVVARRFARDHAMPTVEEADRIDDVACDASADTVVTTRKDLVKWRTLPVRPTGLVALDVALEVTDGEAPLLSACLGAGPAPR
jgi:tetraacyldisaccharide-1-P 4'-kinase